MYRRIKLIIQKISKTRSAFIFSIINNIVVFVQITLFKIIWIFSKNTKPDLKEIQLVREQVTFIYKSFERQQMAKRLYRSIQSYYPGVKVIIADDSAKPLKITDEYAEVIQLPFNSGLSVGLNRALQHVTTPFVIRMDDDELLTPYTGFHKQLKFLLEHDEIDLVGVLLFNLPQYRSIRKAALPYFEQSMKEAPEKLIIPHMTKIDDNHVVLGKTTNTFIARTDKVREVGYDDNIRMIDHHEFFYRAAGKMVSCLDAECYVFHYHNWFDRHYQRYRSDYKKDLQYIWMKRNAKKEG